MTNEQSPENMIATYLQGEYPGVDFTPSTSLFEGQILDSFGLVNLIAFLESKFGIAVLDEDVVVENFDTIERILGFIEKKQA